MSLRVGQSQKKLSKDIIKIISKYSNTSYLFLTIIPYQKNINKIANEWLSLNRNISYTFFEKHINKVNWYWLSSNSNIPYTFFSKHINKINWDCLSQNTNIPYTFFEGSGPLEKHFTSKDGICFNGLDKVNWYNLSHNKNIPYTFFEKHKKYLDNTFIKSIWYKYNKKYNSSIENMEQCYI